MTRLFEASGFEVVTAVTGYRAQAHLEGDRPIDVVVAPWDPWNSVGGDVYRWSLQKRYDLRDSFVFISSEVPPDFDRLVAGRCLTVSMSRPAEIVRVAVAAVKRRETLEAARDAVNAELDDTKPTLLLAEDEPVLLMVMAEVLSDSGYAVTRVETGAAAIAQLEHDDFDAIVTDWHMDEVSGAEIHRWARDYKPWLAERFVFLSGEEGDDTSALAPGRPIFRKGQDSNALTAVLREIIRQVRHERSQA
ncbi:MAG TPA: response regulator [Kofleriaceae bacterium]|nr:response regulator [Kofleriaceae bacterium]